MRRIASVAAALLLAAGCAHAGVEGTRTADLTFRTAGGPVTLRVEVADDPAEREAGLSGRTSLPADAGMAFIWEEPVRARFWMKDTLIPLQIAFWDAEERIVAILDMEPCRAEPCPTYGPRQAFVGAAEANAGWFTSHGVAIGATVSLEADDG